MSTINSVEILQGMRDEARIVNAESVPSQLAEKVVPVLVANANPKKRQPVVFGSVKSSTGTDTVGYTTPTQASKKAFYLTSLQVSSTADAVMDGDRFLIQATLPNGRTVSLVQHVKVSLTAFTQQTAITYNPPLRLAPATSINFVLAFGAGVGRMGCVLTGYEEDFY